LLGNSRRFYGTADTVADLDQLRRALGVQRMTLDGVSYGVFVAARYAVAHPRQVNKLVLDSVLPHVDPQADDAFYLAALHSTSRVLRAACAALTGCDFDPADDIAYLVRTRTDSVALLDLVIGWEFVDPNYGDVIFAAHKARQGQPADLDALIAGLAEFNAAPYESFSSGLHAATLCADERLPWGDASAPEAGRQAALDRAVRKLRQRDVWPWSPATAAGQGFIQNCLFWPQTQVRPEPPTHATRLPAVPTLIVNGDHDLVTPLEWAFEEARYAPMVKVVVVAGASHSIQNRERGTAGRQAVIDFLLNS
jgi:pimeloyl-ACP methyl ester carboxylesterase